MKVCKSCKSFVDPLVHITFRREFVNHLFKEQLQITFRWESVNHLFKEQDYITFR